MVLKAELHCHIEGAASPKLVLAQASKYGADVSGFIRDNAYHWNDFTSFLKAYDLAAELFRTPEDYALLTENYLREIAREGAIYAEFFTSPDHAERVGLSPESYTEALAEGMRRAKSETGIESRMVVTGVRHVGPEAVVKAAQFAANCGHPLVTGFGMAGDERMGAARDFARAFDIAREAGLGLTVHAGEFGGPESVRSALDTYAPTRIGHGVRAIEDDELVRRIAEEGIVLEVCPLSNIVLGVYDRIENHPLPSLKKAGCRVTVSSDDPPHFHTSLANEYVVARQYFGFDDAALLDLTRTSIEAAFVDEATRTRLLGRLSGASEA